MAKMFDSTFYVDDSYPCLVHVYVYQVLWEWQEKHRLESVTVEISHGLDFSAFILVHKAFLLAPAEPVLNSVIIAGILMLSKECRCTEEGMHFVVHNLGQTQNIRYVLPAIMNLLNAEIWLVLAVE